MLGGVEPPDHQRHTSNSMVRTHYNRSHMADKTTSVEVTRVAAHDDRADDVVAIEEPLEISAAWTVRGEPHEKNISVTMRTKRPRTLRWVGAPCVSRSIDRR